MPTPDPLDEAIERVRECINRKPDTYPGDSIEEQHARQLGVLLVRADVLIDAIETERRNRHTWDTP